MAACSSCGEWFHEECVALILHKTFGPNLILKGLVLTAISVRYNIHYHHVVIAEKDFRFMKKISATSMIMLAEL